MASAPSPRPEPCDGAHFAKSLRALSLLPSRADDEVKGELRLAVYRRMLGHNPKQAIGYLVGRALAELDWFPSPKQCLDILADWRAPVTDADRRRSLARKLIEGERRARFDEALAAMERRELDGDALDSLPERWKRIALELGYLRLDPDNGFVVRHESRLA